MEKIDFEHKLLDAIKMDDLKSFSLLMPTNADLNLCYGRFPILSLLYLYSSFKILSKYEKALMPIHNFKIIEESVEIYKEFKVRAKKTLRFFKGDEIIYPVLMLAILNEKTILENKYKFLFKNAEINELLQKIYKIRYDSDILLDEKSIKIPIKKLTKKQIILFSAVSLICCLIIAFAGVAIAFVKQKNGLGSASSPIRVSNAEEFIDSLKQGNRYYLLESDIEVNGDKFVYKDFSGTILGGGHTILVKGEINTSLIKNLSGKIENLKIKLSGNKIKITQNLSILAENSSGLIENCKIFGDFEGEYNSSEEIFAGMFVSKNTGTISNSEVSISSSLINSNESNAYFGNIAGVNEGNIISCVASSGMVVADTVDIAGIACQNYGLILETENKIMLSQSSSKEWHPNIAGVSIANYGKIQKCYNYAELNAESLVDVQNDNDYFVFVGGISCENYGEIDTCKNLGKIVGNGKVSNIVAGGLVAQNIDNDKLYGSVVYSLSKSIIEVFSESGQICVGGVVGLNSTSIKNSGFIGTIDADSNATQDKGVFVSNLDKIVSVFAGGVVGISQYSEIKNSYADVEYLSSGNAIVLDEESEVNKLYTGIVGNVGIYAYVDVFYGGPYQTDGMANFDNNYYVDKPDIVERAYGVYATTSAGYYSNGQLIAINDAVLKAYFRVENSTAMNKCSALQEIPLEVIYE